MKEMSQMIKKTLCGLLAAAMVLTSVDFTVFALEAGKSAGQNSIVAAEESPVTEEDSQIDVPGEEQETGSEDPGTDEPGEEKDTSDEDQGTSGEEPDTETPDDDSDVEIPGEEQQTPDDDSDVETPEEEQQTPEDGTDEGTPGKDQEEPGIETPGGNVHVNSDETDITASGKCGDNLTWKLTSDGTLTISGTGAMYDYGYYIPGDRSHYRPEPWSGSYTLNTLVLENGITRIGQEAFRNCGFTGDLVIPDSVTSIRNNAFKKCVGFTGDLIIPDSVKTIGESAFEGCRFDGNLTLSNNLVSIGDSAFRDCYKFTGDLVIPDSVTTIGDYAFGPDYSTPKSGGFKGGELILSQNLVSIGEYAFDMCGFTGSLTIPEGVTDIGNYTFSGCGFTGSLIIPEGVTSIGEHAFGNCVGFTGNLIIPDNVTNIGSRAFYGCMGFTGTLTIPDSVTSIGGSAFSGCSGFTGNLTIPDSVTSIDDSVFYDCKGFSGNLIIPKSVTSIGRSAFANCVGFTGSLVIPDSVTSIGSRAFIACKGLNGIAVIPASVTTIGDGTSSDMTFSTINTIYGQTGSYAQSYAKSTGKKFIPHDFHKVEGTTDANELLDGKVGVYVVDERTNVDLGVFEHATVNGTEIKMVASYLPLYLPIQLEENGKMKFTVSADGYQTLETERRVEPGQVLTFSLRNAYSVKAVVGNRTIDLCSDMLYMEYTNYSIKDDSGKKDLTIQAYYEGMVKYELIRRKLKDEVVLEESEDGTFTIPVLEKQNGRLLTNLEPTREYDYLIRFTDRNGKEVDASISYNGFRIERESPDDGDPAGDIAIMPQVTGEQETAEEESSIFKDGEFSLGFPKDFKINIEKEEDGKIKVAIGKESQKSFAEFKKSFDKLKSKAKSNIADAIDDMAKSTGGFDVGNISGELSVYAYGEGYLNQDKSGPTEIQVGIVVTGGIGSSYEIQAFEAPPLVVTVEGELGLSVSVEGTIIYENRNFQLGNGNFSVEFEVGLTLKLGVGVADLAHAGVGGSAALNAKWEPRLNADDYWKFWGNGSVFAYGKAGPFEGQLTIFKVEGTFYESPQGAVRAQQEIEQDINRQIYDSDNYTLMDRSYLTQNSTQALGEDGSVDNAVFSEAVYPNASPQLAYIEETDTIYLFWLQDIESRSSENRAAIVFSTSTDGVNWSEPVQLVPEDENSTLDMDYDVYVDSGRIYICWQDASEEFPPGIGLNDTARKMYITYAVMDGATGEVEQVKTVTDEPGCYMNPVIAAKDGIVYLAYILNHMSAEGGIWDADNTHELMGYNSADGTVSALGIGGSVKVVGMDMTATAGEGGVYYTLDQDGNLLTTGDRSLVYDTRIGTGGSQMFLAQNGEISNPSAAGDHCYWYRDGNIYSVRVGETTPAALYETAPGGLPMNFSSSSNGSDTMLQWSGIDGETGEVCLYGIKKSDGGGWTLPYIIERTDSALTTELSGIRRESDIYITYPHVRIREDGSMVWTLCVLNAADRTDISLDYAGYNEEDFRLGEKLPITVEISNRGTTEVDNASVYWDDQLLGSVNLLLGPGETQTYTLTDSYTYTVPGQVTGYEEHTLTIKAGDTESTFEDNSKTVGIGYTDIMVIAGQRLQNGNTWLDISVLDVSEVPTDCTLNIRAGSKDGEILCSEELGTIDGGAGVALSLDMQEYEESCVAYYIEAVPTVEDVIEGNNIAFVYTGYGAPIKENGGGGETHGTYTVSFNSNGGSAVESQQVEAGMTAVEPQAPTRDGYYFVGWFLDGALYDFGTPVTGNITLEAVWEAEGVLAAPSANIPNESQVDAGTKLVLTCAAPGAQIYYTTDGSDPTPAGTLYRGPIELWQDTTVKTMAVKEGYANSRIVTFTYTVRISGYEEYTLTFDSQGGTDVEAITAIPTGSTVTLPQPTRDGYVFLGWYTEPDGAGEVFDEKSVVTEDLTLYAFWRAEDENNGLWFSAIADQTYTGSAIKPVIKVYYENTLLKEKTDYTLTYKNNKNANDAAVEASAPTVTVKGKGSYGGKETVTFRILPKNLTGEDMVYSFTDAYAYKTGTQPKLSLTVKYGKQTLKKDRDYTLSYKNSAGAVVTDISAEGTYTLVVTGQTNYVGVKELPFTVTQTTPVSKLKLSKIVSVAYDGTEKTPGITLKNGKTTLTEGTDYELTYSNNVNAGKATVVITGIGNYSGSRSTTFTITGTALNKITVKGMKASVEYTGKPVYQTVQLTAKVKVGGVTTEKILKEGEDYQVSFSNNTSAGKATMTLMGKGGYTGTVKKKFTIKAYDIKADSGSRINISDTPITALYAKGGAKPDVDIYFGERKLTLGTDYTLTYSNNKSVTTPNATKKPTITIKGKGNYKGKLASAKTFTINRQDLNAVKTSADDVVYKNKAGNYKAVPVLYDLDGKKLSAGKDYSKTYQYSYAERTVLEDGTVRQAGENAGENDIVSAGTEMLVTISEAGTAGSGNYHGETQANYHVTQNSLKKAKVKVLTNFEYTGKEICLTKNDLQITPKGESQPTDSYEILADTYKNNTKKGTASVQIRGTGDYGGILTVKYKIKVRGFSWWFRGLFSR